MLIFEQSKPGRVNHSQAIPCEQGNTRIPDNLLRTSKLGLPEASELDVVRHFTKLSRKNFSIDTHFYPLGSCTMKYNPRAAHKIAMMPGFLNRHPHAHLQHSQGILACLYGMQEVIKSVTGMTGVALSPMAGAQGEFAGVSMIKAYHTARGDTSRTEFLVPDAAHGTNPASAVMCGYKVREIQTGADGDVDIEALQQAVGPQTAGIMLTNPSTLGVFERNIALIAEIVHGVGGLLYYDGANLNAILGHARPGDMGFDVMHLNLHKTFATPHGGGGPGAGPVAANDRLKEFLPIPKVGKVGDGYTWLQKSDCPNSIGRMSGFMGNVGILLRAYIYSMLLGCDGLKRVGDFATLNANYVMSRLKTAGFDVSYPDRRATHEFIISFKKLARDKKVKAMDVAKRLLDYGVHAPTTYFPLLIPECFLIEPTETESKATLDHFIQAMIDIQAEAEQTPELVQQAPYTLPVKRLDDVKAARELDVVWSE